MEDAKATAAGKSKMATYVRWIVVTVFSLFLLVTVIMAVYRKFGG